MKVLHSSNDKVESNTTSSSNFAFKANAKAFFALFDGLYSNKIRSIIRELSANAYDSHVSAGKKDVPFQISLPATLNTVFSVRDFGIGLSHEDVMKLYVTAFDSTKDEDDTSVGGWGLGSKTPFAYTDTFSVTSWYNGKVSFYSAVIGDDGIPTIHHLATEDTSEGNGLEVSFPVKQKDVYQFEDEAQKVYLGYDVKPIVKNRTDYIWPELQVVSEGKGYKIVEPGLYLERGTSHAKMGCVLYPIDVGKFPEFSQLLRNNLVIDFPLGSLAVTVSRESLSYSDKEPTIRTIENKLRDMVNVLVDDAKRQVGACSCRAAAQLKAAEVRSKVLNPLQIRGTKLFWNGEYVDTTFRYKWLNFSDGVYSKSFSPSSSIAATATWKKVIIENHRPGEKDLRGPSRIKKYLADSPTPSYNAIWVRLVGVTDEEKKKENYDLLQLLEDFGWPEVVFVKDMEDTKTKAAKRSGPMVKYVNSYLREGQPIEVDLSKGGYYFKWFDGRPVSKYFSRGSSRSFTILSYMRDCGLIKKDAEAVRVPKPLWKKFDKPNWIEVSEVLEEFLNKHKDTYEKLVTVSYSYPVFYPKELEAVSKFVKMDRSKESDKPPFSNEESALLSLFFSCKVERNTIPKEEVLKYYPLLPELRDCFYYSVGNILGKAKEYIKSMDELHQYRIDNLKGNKLERTTKPKKTNEKFPLYQT